MSPKVWLLSLSAAVLLLLSAPVQAAPTADKCTLTDVHNAIADWRSDNAILIDGYKTFGKLLLNFEIIESRLVGQCDGIKDHRTKIERFLSAVQPASRIPSLKGLIKPVQQVGERLNLVILKKPEEKVCQVVLKIRERIDDVAKKFKEIERTKIVRLSRALDLTHKTVAEALTLYKDAGGNPTNCVSLDRLCTAVREARDLQRKLIAEIKELIDQSGPLKKFLESVDNAVDKTTSYIEKVFNGAAGKVIDGMNKLLNKKITLPIPRGAKNRGVGVIPKCCPSGYSLQAGLCYRNCRSGYAPVLFTCVEKCRPGWKDIGVTCTRIVKKKVGFVRVPVPQFDAKHSYTRSGKIPAAFGDAACSCRSTKRYLEAGLCKNKCGRDHLAGYGTTLLTQCLDLRGTTLSIADLFENLDIFEKAEKIPLLGNAIKAVNRLIDQAFAALTGPIAGALKLPEPPLNIPSVKVPELFALKNLGGIFDLDIMGFIERLAADLLRDTSCRD